MPLICNNFVYAFLIVGIRLIISPIAFFSGKRPTELIPQFHLFPREKAAQL